MKNKVILWGMIWLLVPFAFSKETEFFLPKSGQVKDLKSVFAAHLGDQLEKEDIKNFLLYSPSHETVLRIYEKEKIIASIECDPDRRLRGVFQKKFSLLIEDKKHWLPVFSSRKVQDLSWDVFGGSLLVTKVGYRSPEEKMHSIGKSVKKLEGKLEKLDASVQHKLAKQPTMLEEQVSKMSYKLAHLQEFWKKELTLLRQQMQLQQKSWNKQGTLLRQQIELEQKSWNKRETLLHQKIELDQKSWNKQGTLLRQQIELEQKSWDKKGTLLRQQVQLQNKMLENLLKQNQELLEMNQNLQKEMRSLKEIFLLTVDQPEKIYQHFNDGVLKGLKLKSASYGRLALSEGSAILNGKRIVVKGKNQKIVFEHRELTGWVSNFPSSPIKVNSRHFFVLSLAPSAQKEEGYSFSVNYLKGESNSSEELPSRNLVLGVFSMSFNGGDSLNWGSVKVLPKKRANK